jgi:hypothetical protein
MAVFFLQTGGYLLSVKTIRDYNPTQSLVIDGWDTINYTVPLEAMREYVKPYTSTVKQLLRDFFCYFSKFDYANNVVVTCWETLFRSCGSTTNRTVRVYQSR